MSIKIVDEFEVDESLISFPCFSCTLTKKQQLYF